MGQALYRKHRSRSLKEIVGQEHITTALERTLQNGTVSHAYLFTGPRGVGKTSIARILAHEINGLPYAGDRLHMDIIEIDAASNRRIDEIRDLRDKVHTAPTSAKFKVYIIDEVHMLTREAFNALLKTLEEPPAHVVFILATTEVHKLPETIISRTQRFAFKPVDLAKVTAHLKQMSKQEKIEITDEALALIAAQGEGSFRDSISLLDQVRNSGEKITLQTVQSLLGIAPETLVSDLLAAVCAHDVVAASAQLQTLKDQGSEAGQVARQFGTLVREQLIAGELTLENDTALRLLAGLVAVPASPDPRASLEICVLDAALNGQPTNTSAQKVMSAEVHTKPAVQVVAQTTKFVKESREEKTAKKPDAAPASVSASSTDLLDAESWTAALSAIKQKHNTLYGLLNTATPRFAPGTLTLECAYAFHKKRLNEARNKQIVAQTIAAVTGANVTIQCEIAPKDANDASTPPLPPTSEKIHTVQNSPKPENKDVQTISNIFGSAEVLE